MITDREKKNKFTVDIFTQKLDSIQEMKKIRMVLKISVQKKKLWKWV